MLTLGSWWPQAEHLKVGQSRRVPHDCGEGSTLLVSRGDDGYRAWCFRCNDGGSQRPPAESLADKLARLARLQRADSTLGGTLPEPRVRGHDQWPLAARQWVYGAGLSSADCGRLGIYYHAPSDRVVVPVGENFYQARAYQPGRMPKYIGPTPRPATLLARFGQAEVPTLTEDLLSAIKIGEVAEGWAVLGTSISKHMVASLLKRNTRVNVWLDPDAAGRKGAAKIIKQLTAYGLEVRNIVSARDPKRHTRDEIRDYLCGPSSSSSPTACH